MPTIFEKPNLLYRLQHNLIVAIRDKISGNAMMPITPIMFLVSYRHEDPIIIFRVHSKHSPHRQRDPGIQMCDTMGVELLMSQEQCSPHLLFP